MFGPDRATPELAGLQDLFARTRRVFHNYWERGGELKGDEIDYLATATLSHIDDIDLGFKWSLRAEAVPRWERDHVLRPEDQTDWAREPGGAPSRPVTPDMAKVLALRHAQVVFGCLPRTPRSVVSYPGYANYSDIPAPRTPLELRERIEELARGVWDAASLRELGTLDPGQSRRVYGFFETGSWLLTLHIRRIGHGRGRPPTSN